MQKSKSMNTESENVSQRKTENPHKNHRERMRKKLECSPDSLTDHEIVEMLLYNVMRQGNTNVQAHLLLDKAGSLSRILSLDKAQISSIEGLGDITASFTSLLKEFYKRCEKEKLSFQNTKKLTRKNISERLHKIFLGLDEERLIMLTADKNCCLINEYTLSSGTQSNTTVNFKKLIKYALDDNAYYVFIAHNHPNGILAPSPEDIEVTKSICEALSYVNITLVEHFIVTTSSVLGIINKMKYE